ncbi:MAG: cytosine permease [Pseudomonadota bacterium]
MTSSNKNRENFQLEGYATKAVPTDVSVSGLRIGLVNGALAFAVPGLITGLEVGGALGFKASVAAFLIGGTLLALFGFITGFVGYRNRLSACMTIKCVFGKQGAALINLLIALSLLGWYGINMDLFSSVIAELLQRWQGSESNVFATELSAGIAITLVTLFGFSLMEKLSAYLVPVMIALIVYIALQLDSFSVDSAPISSAPQLTLIEAVSVVLGSFIVGVVLMPDFTRFAGSMRGTATASVVPFLLLSSLVYAVSAAAGLMVRSTDVLEVLLALGVGSLAFLLIVISSFLTNVVNLYSAGLSINAVFIRLKEWHIVLIAGLIGTVLASLNLLDRFTDFLFGLAVIFAPIAGVYVVDFFLTRRAQAYSLGEYPRTTNRQKLAVRCWIVGVMVSMLSQAGVWSLLGLQSLDGLITAVALYALLSRFELAHQRNQ